MGRGTGFEEPVPAATSDADGQGGSQRILRFRRAEILMHWAIAAPFLVCYTSALVLVAFYNPSPERPYREVLSWVHRLSGLCLIALPITVLLLTRRYWRLHLHNIIQAWVWTASDVKWLILMGLSVVNKKISLPEQGKFNAGEKLNFMMVMTTYPLFIVTGLMIWLPDVAFYPWLVHFLLAVIATPLMFGHIFMATINPDTRKGLAGMISGHVDREWARHHYACWYRENFEAGADEAGTTPDPGPSDDPVSLCERALTRLREAADPAALDGGREALEECLEAGRSDLAAQLLRELWCHLPELDLNREEILPAAEILVEERELGPAAGICAFLVRGDPADAGPIRCLLQIAEVHVRERRVPTGAIKIYNFLLRHADARFRNSIERALAGVREGAVARQGQN